VDLVKILVHDPEGRLRDALEALPGDMSAADVRLASAQAPADARDVILAADHEGLPDILSDLRRAGMINPVLVVRTSRNTERTAALLFSGADDDMVAPLRWEEVRARANAVLRRVDAPQDMPVVSGDVVAFPDGRPVEIRGRKLDLSPKETLVFLHLARNAGRFVTRGALHDSLYGLAPDAPSESVIDVHLCNIRRKIRRIGVEEAARIETMRGRGYRLA
jgi:two-component system, OmpR family, response regulator